jgi:hypothetical protein
LTCRGTPKVGIAQALALTIASVTPRAGARTATTPLAGEANGIFVDGLDFCRNLASLDGMFQEMDLQPASIRGMLICMFCALAKWGTYENDLEH